VLYFTGAHLSFGGFEPMAGYFTEAFDTRLVQWLYSQRQNVTAN